MITVAEITQPRQLEEYRTLWRSLHERTSAATLLQSREMLEHVLVSQSQGLALRALVVHVGWQPVGILPLVCRELPTRLGSLRALTFPTWGALSCAGPIGPNPTATLVGAFQHLAAAPRDWDVIDLRGIDDAGLDHGRTANALRIAGMPALIRDWSTSAVLRLAELDVGEQYRRRHQLRQLERELWSSGSWDVEHLAGTELTSSALFDSCWQSLSHLIPPGELAAFRDLAWIAAQSGGLSCQILRKNGRVVACVMATLIGESLQPLSVLHQPGCSRAAEVLFGQLLFNDICSGTPEFRCGPQFVSLAVRWGAQRQMTRRYTHFSAYRPRAQMLRMAHWFRAKSPQQPHSPEQPRLDVPDANEHREHAIHQRLDRRQPLVTTTRY